MLKKLFALTLIAAALSACSDQTPKNNQPELVCSGPAIEQAIRTNIQSIIKHEAQAFARNDSRQFIDADKLIAAGSELEISLDNARTEHESNQSYCSTNLKITVPNTILTTAQTNSPLIYEHTNIDQLLAQKLMGSNITYLDGVFTTKLRYIPNENDVNFEDNTLTSTAQAISAGLLPYGVKSILMIDGQAVQRENALKMSLNKAFDEPPEASPEDLLENAASEAEGVPAAPENPQSNANNADTNTEVLSPVVPDDTPRLSNSDVETARKQNQVADAEINKVWRDMDKIVQQELLSEQRSWIQNKNYHCMQAAAQADNPVQAEYLQLQCETRMLRERTQYLRSYTIN